MTHEDIITVTVLLLLTALVCFFTFRRKKKGDCSGDCANCDGCKK